MRVHDGSVSDDDLIAFWVAERALPEAVARERAAQVVATAHDAGGALVGVTTAYLQPSPRLRCDMWHERVFVGVQHRFGDVAVALVQTCCAELQRRAVPGVPGVLFEVENVALRAHLDQAIWPQTSFAFIGLNEAGDHVRVHYFAEATLLT